MNGLTWSGRGQALRQALTPATTGRPEFVDANMLLRGDNLEVLKHLAPTKPEAGLIYIDPPYNTGNSFVYHDDFSTRAARADNLPETLAERVEFLAVYAEAGIDQRHAQWLNMMAPRLVLARECLAAVGIIAISIDAVELPYLTLLGDQIFGPENSLGAFVWASNLKGRQIGKNGPRRTHEYICLWARDAERVGQLRAETNWLAATQPQVYQNIVYPVRRDEISSYVLKNQLYNTNGKFNEKTATSMVFAIDYNPETGEVKTAGIDPQTGLVQGGPAAPGWVRIMPHPNRREGLRYHAWRWSRGRVEKDHQDLEFQQKRGVWRIYTKIREHEQTAVKDLIIGPSTLSGMADLEKLGLGFAFSYPKPVDLIRLLIQSCTHKNDLVIDFFAGSGTTGCAVAQQNQADGGERRFILVQKREAYPDPAAAFTDLSDVTAARLEAAGISFHDISLVP